MSATDAKAEEAVRTYGPYDHIAPHPVRGERFKPSYAAWDALIIEQRCPFLKRELFHDFPNGDDRIAHWRAVVEGFADYDSTLIDEYIAHAAGGRDVQPGAR